VVASCTEVEKPSGLTVLSLPDQAAADWLLH